MSTIQRERGLTVIANATRDAPLVQSQVIPLLERNHLDASILDELVACDAVRMSSFTIEVQHEALADYLRAKDVASGSDSDLLALIPKFPMPQDGFFPVLLMAQLRTQRLQAMLWGRLTEVGPEVYFDALRYRFDTSSQLNKLDPIELSKEYLTELLAGIEQPLDRFFPALREPVIAELTGESGAEIAVTGLVEPAVGALYYQLHLPQKRSTGPVTVGRPSLPGLRRGVNLELSRYRLDSARLIAIKLLKESVLETVRLQGCRGGTASARERLIGRCRFLAETYQFPLELDMDFDAVERVLAPHRDERVYPGALFHSEGFSITELLEDVATLRAAGEIALDPWWRRLGWDDGAIIQSDETVRRVLEEQYRRVQIVYAEIVDKTFATLADRMAFYSSLPVRWHLTVSRREPPRFGATVHYSWLPVATWKDAGADVSFSDTAPEWIGVDSLASRLSALQRPSDRIAWCHGFTPLARFDGHNWQGHFNGATPVMHDVCSLLKDDLKSIFASMPSADG